MTRSFFRDEAGRLAPVPPPHPEGLTAEEAQHLFMWRFSCLRHAGFGEGAARTLALDFDADLRLAVDLLKRGCPQDTALRIVL
jgi:hypothetical protein